MPGDSTRTNSTPDAQARPERWPLLEREGELTAIRSAVGGVLDAGTVLYIEAPAGLGKSRLIAAAAELAADAGLLVLHARATELEQSFPFGLARQLLGPHVPATRQARRRILGETGAAAIRLFDGSPPAPEADPMGIAVIRALRALVSGLIVAGGQRGALVAIDDAHWADTASLRFRPAPEFVAACLTATAGNPFLLGELLDQLHRDGISPGAGEADRIRDVVPEAVMRSVSVRLGRLPEEAVALLSAVAILGDRSPLRRAAALAGLAAQRADRAADGLLAMGILTGEPVEFVHPLIATAVLAGMPQFAERRARRRAAEVLSADGASLEHVCAQLLLTRGEGDAWTVAQLRAGARSALARGEPPAAVRLLQRALDEPPAAAERVEVLRELAQAAAAAGDPRAVEHLEAALALSGDRRTRAEAFHALAKLSLPRGDMLAAVGAAERSLEALEPDDPLREEVVATLLVAASSDASTGEAALPHMLELLDAHRLGRPPTQPGLVALLAASVAQMGASAEDVRALLDPAFAADPLLDATTFGMVFGQAATALMIVDQLERLEEVATLAADTARRAGSPIPLAIAVQWQAAVHCLTGRLHDSVREGEHAREITHAGWNWLSGWNTFYLARAQLELGHPERAAEAVEAALSAERFVWSRVIMLEARGRIALAEGRFESALQAFLQCHEELPAASKSMPGVFAWRPYAAIAARALGDTVAAERWIAEELAAIEGRFVPRIRAVSLRAAGLVRGGEPGWPCSSRASGCSGARRPPWSARIRTSSLGPRCGVPAGGGRLARSCRRACSSHSASRRPRSSSGPTRSWPPRALGCDGYPSRAGPR